MTRMRSMVNVHRGGVRRDVNIYGSVKHNDPAARWLLAGDSYLSREH